jgi:hypothetical protein
MLRTWTVWSDCRGGIDAGVLPSSVVSSPSCATPAGFLYNTAPLLVVLTAPLSRFDVVTTRPGKYRTIA